VALSHASGPHTDSDIKHTGRCRLPRRELPRMDRSGPREVLFHGVRTSVRNNGVAYGFSVMITASFGLLQSATGSASTLDIFFFAGGAVAGFVLLEAIASNLFRVRMRGDPPEVVALGTAFSFFSVGVGLAVAAAVGAVVSPGLAWPVGGFGATLAYVTAAGAEMALAGRMERGAGQELGDC